MIMGNITGQIAVINTKPTKAGDKTLYSVKLEGDSRWFSCGTFKPVAGEKGDHVTFDANEDPKWGWQAQPKSFKLVAGDSAPAAAPAAKKQYRDNKQYLIMFQSASHDAVAIAAGLAEADMLPIGKSKKNTEKVEAYLDVVRRLREEIYQDFVEKEASLAAGDAVLGKDATPAPEELQSDGALEAPPEEDNDDEW